MAFINHLFKPAMAAATLVVLGTASAQDSLSYNFSGIDGAASSSASSPERRRQRLSAAAPKAQTKSAMAPASAASGTGGAGQAK